MLSSCQTPKYLKVKNLTNDNNILPEVQYAINDNFDLDDINCIAVGKIIDKSDKKEFKFLNKTILVRQAIYGHLSPRNYQDIELHKVASVMKSNKNNVSILRNLDCDALIEGEITQFQNRFYLAYSSTNVGLKLFLKNKSSETLWKASHTASSRAGTLPLSPIGIATGIFSATSNTEEEIALQMLDTVVRRILKTLPKRKTVNNKNQMKYSIIPKNKNIHKESNFFSRKANTMFFKGYYKKSIQIINQILKKNPQEHNLLFLKGRAELMINQYNKAASSFLDALSIKIDDDYLNGLGFTYTKLSQYDKAFAAYNKAITINNKNSYSYFNSGLILELKGRYDEAEDYFYSAGTSALLEKDFTRANNSLQALKRLSKTSTKTQIKVEKLHKLIKEFYEDQDKNYKTTKVNLM